MVALVVVVALALASPAARCGRTASRPASGRSGRPSSQATAGVTSTGGVYAATRPGQLARAVRRFPARVDVPNSGSNTVDVIDARTFKRIRRIPVGLQPQQPGRYSLGDTGVLR